VFQTKVSGDLKWVIETVNSYLFDFVRAEVDLNR